MTTAQFFATHPVFSLDEAVEALRPPGGRRGTLERLKHHVSTGRLRLVAREVYAVVPPEADASTFQPDAMLVVAAARADSIVAYHAALELLGEAHSVFSEVAAFTASRRRPLKVGSRTVRFLDDPGPLSGSTSRELGTQRVDRRGRLVRCTGPERTLVEGFRRPGRAGGAEELVASASGFAVLDLDLLEQILRAYDVAYLWAATGWFLDRYQGVFHPARALLERCEERRPRSPHYLERDRRGGVLASRWNVILPEAVTELGGPGAG